MLLSHHEGETGETEMALTFEQLAERIASLREARGLSQTELAEKLGMHPSALSRIETGDRKVSAYEIVALAEALEVDTDELLKEQVTQDVFAVALRADELGGVKEHVDWFRDVVDDYVALRKLSR
jgi:transcriptional regulator with XRE-family HTH domain